MDEEKIICAFMDRECDECCMAYEEADDGWPTCRRIDGELTIRFKNWLYVENKSNNRKHSNGRG